MSDMNVPGHEYTGESVGGFLAQCSCGQAVDDWSEHVAGVNNATNDDSKDVENELLFSIAAPEGWDKYCETCGYSYDGVEIYRVYENEYYVYEGPYEVRVNLGCTGGGWRAGTAAQMSEFLSDWGDIEWLAPALDFLRDLVNIEVAKALKRLDGTNAAALTATTGMEKAELNELVGVDSVTVDLMADDGSLNNHVAVELPEGFSDSMVARGDEDEPAKTDGREDDSYEDANLPEDESGESGDGEARADE